MPALVLRGPAGGSCCAPAQRARLTTAQRASCARLTGAAVRRCPGAGAHTEDCRQDDTGLDPPFPFPQLHNSVPGLARHQRKQGNQAGRHDVRMWKCHVVSMAEEDLERINPREHLLRRTGIFGACPLGGGPALCFASGSRGGVSARGWLLRAAAATSGC